MNSPTGGREHAFARASAEAQRPSVLVADDDAQHRRTVRQALENNGFRVLGEAADAAAAIVAASRSKPDIFLIEIELPFDGLNAVRRIAKVSPRTLIVALSRSESPDHVLTAFSYGASGYLLKGLNGDRLASTLRAALGGEPALSRSLVPYLVEEVRRGSVRRLALPGGAVTLTQREWEVAELLREQNSTADIAERLGVSPVTVRRHVGLLVRKLGVKNRQEAVETLRTYGRS